MTVHAYRFEPRVALWNRLSSIRADTSRVTVDQQRLVATFGPWTVNTTVDNVVNATITGPYRTWRVAGPARIELAGFCIRSAFSRSWQEPAGSVPAEMPPSSSLSLPNCAEAQGDQPDQRFSMVRVGQS